jgi:glycosyltransferase involved in cell wall biosynthesis
MPGRVLMLVENLSVPFDRRVWLESCALADAGYDVTVICPYGDGVEAAPYTELDGVRIHRFAPRWSSGSAVSYVLEYGVSLWNMARIALRLGRRRPFDVVHVACPPDALFLIALLLRPRGTRLVFDHHDLSPELIDVRLQTRSSIWRQAALLLERASFALADVVISTNETYRRVALERGKVPYERTVIVRNNPDLATWVACAPDAALKRGKKHLLCYVGIMGPQDGVDYALRALAHLQASGRDDFHAAFVGGGDAQPACISLANQLGLCGVVEFTGFAGDATIRRYLSTADVCLAPEPKTAFNDASSMVKIMEYMAMGVPMVAFDLTETRYSAGAAAVYAVPNDELEFARLIAELLDDPSRRVEMAAVGRRRVRERFSWEQAREELLRKYEWLLSHR